MTDCNPYMSIRGAAKLGGWRAIAGVLLAKLRLARENYREIKDHLLRD